MKEPIRIIDRNDIFHTSYWFTMESGLILSLLVSLFFVKIDFNPKKETISQSFETQEEIYIEEIVQTKQEIKLPTPPRPVVPIEVPNDEIIEDEILDIDAELDFSEALEIPLPPKPLNEVIDTEEEIFVIVEQPPILLGGIKSVQESIIYPEIARKAGIEGRVIVQFIINKEGKVIDPFIVRGIGGGCDEEAIRAIKKATFKPGMQRGVPVQVRYTLPVTFKLQDSRNS